MKEIIDNLFIGNKLAQGLKLPRGQVIDLKNIASPLVVFASWGDNITPPQQALDWIIDVYGHESAIIDRGHVIVYLLAQEVGHLGIFVSGRVAREEHREVINVLDMLGELPPSLYEMVIEQRPAHGLPQDIDQDMYTVRFEIRTMDDLRRLNPDRRAGEALFSSIKQVSVVNEGLYEWLWGPAVRALSTDSGARLARWFHPLRIQHYLFSDLNPFLVNLSSLTDYVRQHRRAVSPDNPFVQIEQSVSKVIGSALNLFRDLRDGAIEQAVRLAYGPAGLGAVFPPEPLPEKRAEELAKQRAKAERAELRDQFDRGGLAEAVARMLIAVIRTKGAIDRRSFLIARELSAEDRGLPLPSEADFQAVLARQALLMELDPEAALKSLPRLLPDQALRARAVEIVARIMRLEPKECNPDAPLAKRLVECLGLAPGWHQISPSPVRGGAA